VAETKLEVPPTEVPAPATAKAVSRISTSLSIIATVVVFVCLYYASSVVITLICSIFIAFILDPGVKLLQRLRLPRWVGAFVMLVATLAVMYLFVYLVYDRASTLIHDLPDYTTRLREIVAHIRVTIRSFQLNAARLFPVSGEAHVQAVRLQGEPPWMRFLRQGLSSAYGTVLTVMFIPFLVFFMLTSKEHILRATVNLFHGDHRERANEVMRGISLMVRQYVIGNFLVGLVSACLIMPVFYFVGLRFWLIMGLLAAFLSLIPYIGVLLAVLPPLLLALVQPNYKQVTPFVVIAVTVVVVHFVAINILTPKLVGRRVKLNALTVTVAMLFWGWLWGGIGLILAVPITAAIKAVCDNIQTLKPYSAWMGEG
jgi:predicted PurR-regulated permease PerM